MKIAVCLIVKMENNYLDEWYDWYFNVMKVDHVFIYDNNDTDKEVPITRDNVTLISDWRGNHGQILLNVYEHCYNTFIKGKYNWCLYFDTDEFLHIYETGNDLRKFLSLPKFENTAEILVNWKTYDDNDLVIYENKPCQERFTRTLEPGKDQLDKHVKAIVNGFTGSFNFKKGGTPHNFWVDSGIVKTVKGDIFPFNGYPFNNNYEETHKFAELRHFNQKTIDEYVHIKMVKGHCDQKDGVNLHSPEKFFEYNKRTSEKEEFLKLRYYI